MDKKLLLKTLYIFIALPFMIMAQIKNDFIISSGQRPTSSIDNYGNVYVTYDQLGYSISYKKYDIWGNEIYGQTFLNNTAVGKAPRQSVSGDIIVTAWQDLVDLQVSYGYFNIRGNLHYLTKDSTSVNFIFQGRPESGSDNPRYTPDVCFINDTTYFSIWYGFGGQFIEPNILDARQPGVYGRIGTVSGWPFGNLGREEHTDSLSIVISDYGPTTQLDVSHSAPRIISQRNNNYVSIAWQDDHSGSQRIYNKIFYKDGAPKDSSFAVNEDTALIGLYYLSMAMAPDGDYVVVWSAIKDNVPGIYWKWYTNDGKAITNSQLITSETDKVASYSTVDVTIGNQGKIVVVWEEKYSEKSVIFAKRFDKNRVVIGEKFKVSTKKDIKNSQIYVNVELYNDHIFFIWRESPNIWGCIRNFNKPVSINKTFNLPNKFELYQNFPNPFNFSTTISFSLQKAVRTRIYVFNTAGQKVATILDENKPAGEHRVKFDASVLSSGVYFYRIQVGEFAETLKMLLLK